MRTLFMMAPKKMCYFTMAIKWLKSHKDMAADIGYPVEDGAVHVMSSKNLWHFARVRMSGHWDEFFRLMRNEVVKEALKLGIRLGENVTEDATPIESMENDDAPYCGHYKVYGYKLDTVNDLEHGMPVSKRVFHITDDEGKYFIPQMAELQNAGVVVKETWNDGKYDTYPNIAYAGLHGIRMHHRIHKNWVHNKKGEYEHLWELYNKHWENDDFDPEASSEYMLNFLYDHGHVEEVGAYFRNLNMAECDAEPTRYYDVYHKRNRHEGRHGYIKRVQEIETRLNTKGLKRVDEYLTGELCAILAVVLCRLQHGVTENLVSTASIT